MRLRAFALCICVSLFTIIVSTPSAHAAEDAQERLRQSLNTYLKQQQALFKADGDVQLKREGEITIEPQDDYYVVTMPHLSVQHDSGRHIDFGILSINARPAEAGEIWHISMALPTPILAYNKKDLLTARLDLGNQKFTGTWHAGYHSFRDIQARYENVELTNHEGGGKLEIPEIRINQQLETSTAPEEWSGTSRLTLKNASILTSKGHELVHAGTSGLTIDVDAYSPKRMQDFRNEWINLIGNPQNDVQYTNNALAFYDLITKKLLQIQNGVDITTYAEDVRIMPTAAIRQQSDKTDIRAIKLGRLQYSTGFSDTRKDISDLNFGFKIEGMEIDPQPDIARGLIPEDMRMHYTLKNLPYSKLVSFGREQLSSQMSDTENAQNKSSKQQAMQTIPKMLMAAGTQLRIKDNYIHAGDYKADIDATLKADAKAAMNFTLDSQARINGLQGLIDTLKTRAKKSENPIISGNVKKAVGMLTTVHMLGQQGEKGKDSRVYNVTVNRGGEAMLNGSNLSNMINAFRGNSGGGGGNAMPQQ